MRDNDNEGGVAVILVVGDNDREGRVSVIPLGLLPTTIIFFLHNPFTTTLISIPYNHCLYFTTIGCVSSPQPLDQLPPIIGPTPYNYCIYFTTIGSVIFQPLDPFTTTIGFTQHNHWMCDPPPPDKGEKRIRLSIQLTTILYMYGGRG